MSFIVYDKISWHVEGVQAMTETEFVSSPAMQSMYDHLSEDDKIEALRTVYNHVAGSATTGEPAEPQKEQE